MLRRRLILPVILIAAVTGCRVKNPPDTAEIQKQAMPTVTVPGQWAAGGAAAAQPIADNWLASFNDAELTAAVLEAIAHNADLRIAAVRVETANLYAKLAGAKLWPSVDLVARGGGQMSGDNSGLQGGALSLSWEIDLWARVRNARAAAAADAASVAADYEFARQSLAAAVARNWFLAVEAGLQAEAARAGLAERRGAGPRRGNPIARRGRQRRGHLHRAGERRHRPRRPRQIELARTQALRALELLLGRYPSAAAAVQPAAARAAGAVPAGLPSELLERRPDVVAAERRVAAAFHRVGEAKAARLPAIALTASVNAISSDLFVLQDRNNPVWSFGANLMAPLFRGGALKTQVEIRTSEQKQAVAAYAVVGHRAFGEVENALAAEIAAIEREQILTQTSADNRRALDIVQTQFKVGSTDLRFVNQRQLALIATQTALIRVQAEQRIQRVNLHLALGGSFEVRPPPQ